VGIRAAGEYAFKGGLGPSLSTGGCRVVGEISLWTRTGVQGRGPPRRAREGRPHARTAMSFGKAGGEKPRRPGRGMPYTYVTGRAGRTLQKLRFFPARADWRMGVSGPGRRAPKRPRGLDP